MPHLIIADDRLRVIRLTGRGYVAEVREMARELLALREQNEILLKTGTALAKTVTTMAELEEAEGE